MKIHELAKELRNGKHIRRVPHPLGVYVSLDRDKVPTITGAKCGPQFLTLDELTADDWEVIACEPEPAPMPFEDALRLIKDGKRLRRQGWNGKDQFLRMETIRIAPFHKSAAIVISSSDEDPLVSVWTPTTADMLATDWEEVAQ